MSFKQNLFDF